MGECWSEDTVYRSVYNEQGEVIAVIVKDKIVYLKPGIGSKLSTTKGQKIGTLAIGFRGAKKESKEESKENKPNTHACLLGMTLMEAEGVINRGEVVFENQPVDRLFISWVEGKWQDRPIYIGSVCSESKCCLEVKVTNGRIIYIGCTNCSGRGNV